MTPNFDNLASLLMENESIDDLDQEVIDDVLKRLANKESERSIAADYPFSRGIVRKIGNVYGSGTTPKKVGINPNRPSSQPGYLVPSLANHPQREKIELYIREFPEASYPEIGKIFDLDAVRIADIAVAAGIARGVGGNLAASRHRLGPRDKKIAEYIRKHPEVSLDDIAQDFGLTQPQISRIMKAAGITDRPSLNVQLGGTEAHPGRLRTNAQERAIVQHYIDTQHEKSMSEVMQWANTFVIGNPELGGHPDQQPLPINKNPAGAFIRKAASRQNIKLPPPRYGRPKMRNVKDTRIYRPGTGELPTQRSHHFKGSASTTTSNPKHNPRQLPTPPMDQDKRL